MEYDNRKTLAALSKFNTFTTTYKTINKHAITVDVHVPKNVQPHQGKRPIAVRFHGGGLITGSASFLGFLSAWIPEYAYSKGAVLLMPNYRLMPEANGADILDDMSDFWSWVTGGKLQEYLSGLEGDNAVDVDTERIWAHGESAGGYLSIQAGLLHPSTVRAVSAAFPMLDFDGPWSTQPHPLSNPAWIPKSGVKTFFNAPPMPSSILANHLASLKSGESIVTEADPPSRIDLMMSIGQQARWREFMGDEDRIYPMRMVQKKAASELPPLFIYHGRDDAAVPVEGSEIFVEELRKAGVRDERVVFKVQPGDHGFCNQAELEEAWLKEGLALVEGAWLA